MQQRYVGATRLNVSWVEGVHVDDNSVSSATYTNMRVSYTSEFTGGSDWTVALNVTNVFDRPPPVVAGNAFFGGAPTTDNFFDVYGRRYQVSFNMNF